MRDLLDDEDITQLRELPGMDPCADEPPTRVRSVPPSRKPPSMGPRSGIRRAASVSDPDLDEAVVGVLEGICGTLGEEEDDSAPLIELEALAEGDAAALLEALEEDRPATLPPPSLPPPSLSPPARSASPSSVPPPLPLSDLHLEADEDEDDWEAPTREMFSDELLGADLFRDVGLPEPPPSTPELLASALVYADDDDEDLELPEYRFLDRPSPIERTEAPPPSLRPISRTSIPAYEPPSKRRWLWIAAAAVGFLAVGGWQLAMRGRDARVQVADAPEAPPVAQVRQSVSARSTMRGVNMLVDDEPRGILPLSLDDLEPGEHSFRFEAPGYLPIERHVTLVRGETVDLGDVVLEPKPSKLHIELTPSNAYLLIGKPGDGEGKRYAGPWPRVIDVPPGRYELMAFRGGFRSAALRVDVKKGTRVETVRIDLSRDDIYEP